MSQVARQTHLEYYREHQIAPVRYDLANMDAHMERRCSLYSKLGLLPLTFNQSRVLEVAAGTGHNSLYLARTMPAKLVLLEPNAIGAQHIREVYSSFHQPHTSPELIRETLEEYSPSEDFDIVLCENWLGTSAHEQSLLRKLAGMVANNGMLVLTTVSPVGFVPNLLRRFLSIYLAPENIDFQKRTEILVEAFGSHLDSLPAMTRNKEDWVQDNMMNPAYFGLCLSIPRVIDAIGADFSIVESSPSFAQDWRWFKSLHGENRKFNDHFLSEYWKYSHNFLDHSEITFERAPDHNIQLEKNALALLKYIAEHEDAHLLGNDHRPCVQNVVHSLNEFIKFIPEQFKIAHAALNEVKDLIQSPDKISLSLVAELANFSSLFGRETGYVSFIRV